MCPPFVYDVRKNLPWRATVLSSYVKQWKGALMSQQYLALDLGGTFIKYAIMNRDGEFLKQGKVPTKTKTEEKLRAGLADVRAEVDAYEYDGIAVSMPGRIDTAKGIAYTGGSFRWIKDFAAADMFSDVFYGKPATIANDGKCAALAESWLGSLADVNSGCALVLGTGIGGGIVLNNEVWMGATGGAGELSAFITSFDGAKNGVGFSNLDALWAGRVSASAICGKYAFAKDIEKADGIMLFDAYEAGDPDAIAILKEFGYQVAIGIMSLQCVLDLERYAIGGGISARPETTTIIRDAVNALFDESGGWLPFGKPEIVTCTFGNEANLIGALAFHLRAQK